MLTRLPALLGLTLLACESKPSVLAPTPPIGTRVPVQATLPPETAPTPAPPTVELPTLADMEADATIPRELLERGTAAKLWDQHRIDRSINPFYLRADFDGDGQPDYLLSADTPGVSDDLAEPGLIVLFAGPGAAHIQEDELLTLPARDGWYVHDRSTPVPPAFDGSPAPRLVGDAFVMMKAESSSALIYWDGSRFRSHWLSD